MENVTDNLEKELTESLKPLLKSMTDSVLGQLIEFNELKDNELVKENKKYFLDFLKEFEYLYENDINKLNLIQDLTDNLNKL